MTFLPDTSTLLTYTLAATLLFITPGPDMSLFLAKTMAGGRKAGLASMLGAMTGCGVHTLLAALGLSALLAASVAAFTVLKIVGALPGHLNQRFLINHRTPANIDKDPAWRDGSQVSPGDNMMVPGMIGSQLHDDIILGKQGFQGRTAANSQTRQHIIGHTRRIGGNVHAKRPEQRDHLLTRAPHEFHGRRSLRRAVLHAGEGVGEVGQHLCRRV